MDKLRALQIFNRVYELGQFSQVAEELDTSQSSISKAVAQLEKELGVSLFHRSTRSLAPTEAGQTYYQGVKHLIEELDDLEQTTKAGAEQGLSGTIRIGAPSAFAQLHLIPQICDFMAEYPDIKVDVQIEDEFIDIIKEGLDAVVRVGNLVDVNLYGRNLGKNPRILVASPSYLEKYGTPTTPEELSQHSFVIYSLFRSGTNLELKKGKETYTIVMKGRLRVNNALAIKVALNQGMGIGASASLLVWDDIAAGRLVPILTDYHIDPFDMYMLYPKTRRVNPRIKALGEFLQKRWKEWQSENF